MKRPVEPSDIRKGDLIRVEHATVWLRATEYVAREDGVDFRAIPADQMYLLDRPTPPVQLPEKPTLGWATWGEIPYLAVFAERGSMLRAVDSNGEVGGDKDTVTAFTPATAVPTEALDELIEAQGRVFDVVARGPRDIERKNGIRRDAIQKFLAAVDAAGAQS